MEQKAERFNSPRLVVKIPEPSVACVSDVAGMGTRKAKGCFVFFFPLLPGEVHDQENSRNGEHIDLSVFQMQTGPDKVVITVGGVCTIT